MALVLWGGVFNDVNADEHTQLPLMESRFSVHIAGIPAGTMIRKLTRDEEGYIAHSEMVLGLWFKLLQPTAVADEMFDQSRFTLINGELRGSFFEEHWKRETGRRRSLTYDWRDRRVRWGDGREAVMPEGRLVDNGSYPYSLMLSDPLQVVGEKLTIVDGEMARPFEIIEAQKRDIKTALGHYEAWQIDARRLDHPNERFSVSLAPELSNLPVLISHNKNNISTELRILSITLKSE